LRKVLNLAREPTKHPMEVMFRVDSNRWSVYNSKHLPLLE